MCVEKCPKNVGYAEDSTCQTRCVSNPFYSITD